MNNEVVSEQILWCGQPFALRRVIAPTAGALRNLVVATCSRHHILCVGEESEPKVTPGDLWAGCAPLDGFGNLAGDVAWMRTVEARRLPELFDAFWPRGSV